jgi:PhzF family phenazine biosynthesis protein
MTRYAHRSMAEPEPLVFLVDSFAERLFAGNPAGVCLLDAPAEGEWMQRVAAELNQAATAFVCPTSQSDDDRFSLRWFTAATELTLCGHGTLATAHVLWETGHRADPLVFDSPGGRLTAHREGDRVGLGFPALPPREVEAPEGLADALGGVERRWVGANDLDLFVEVASEDEVRNLRPDHRRMLDIEMRGIAVTARSREPGVSFVSRYFAPRIGLDEDHATGSAHCGLGPFWAERLGQDRLVGRQLSPRGGVVEVWMDRAPGQAYLVGRAITVIQGALRAGTGTPA